MTSTAFAGQLQSPLRIPADEITQGMNPLRVMDLEDFIADVTGALAAIVVLTVISGKLRRRDARQRVASPRPTR